MSPTEPTIYNNFHGGTPHHNHQQTIDAQAINNQEATGEPRKILMTPLLSDDRIDKSPRDNPLNRRHETPNDRILKRILIRPPSGALTKEGPDEGGRIKILIR